LVSFLNNFIFRLGDIGSVKTGVLGFKIKQLFYKLTVVVARDRTKNTIAKVGCMGRIEKPKLDEVIGDYISQDNIICTDKWRAYKTYCKEKGIKLYQHKPGDTGRVIKGIYHIQNVNSFHSRLKDFIHKFKGISTKYLDNYLS